MAELPTGYTYDGEPHYVDGEDCMGGKSPYWRQWVKAPTGEAIAGCAANPHAARDVARCNARDHNEIQTLPAKRRLWYEIDKAKKNGRFYDRDLVTVVEILAEMISPRNSG
jgi:3',5'-cyclic AMP phosphodiesterase CpdA